MSIFDWFKSILVLIAALLLAAVIYVTIIVTYTIIGIGLYLLIGYTTWKILLCIPDKKTLEEFLQSNIHH